MRTFERETRPVKVPQQQLHEEAPKKESAQNNAAPVFTDESQMVSFTDTKLPGEFLDRGKEGTERPPLPDVSQAPDSIVTDDGKVTSTAIYILSLMSGVSTSTLSTVEIKVKPRGKFPYYNPYKGGGAITIENTISLSENFFDSTGHYGRMKKKEWRNASFGNDPESWLGLLSHEVRHLRQAEAFGLDEKGIQSYKSFFVWQYISRFGHDPVPFEKTSNEGEFVFWNVVWDYLLESNTPTGVELNRILNDPSLNDAQRKTQIEKLFKNNNVYSDVERYRAEYQSRYPKKYEKENKQMEKAKKKRDKRWASTEFGRNHMSIDEIESGGFFYGK